MTRAIISRAEARENGSTKYYTGKPCKHGHLAERYVSSGVCWECSRRYHRISEIVDEPQEPPE